MSIQLPTVPVRTPVQAMKHTSILLVPMLSLLLAACSKPEAPQEPIRAVKLMVVNASTVGAQQEYAGEVKARVESRLGFRVGGKLVQRPAEVGQRVPAGALLAQLDASDLSLVSQAAQAQDYWADETRIELTVSLGCSTLLAAESAESLLRRADNALYVAKREGRNRLAMAG